MFKQNVNRKILLKTTWEVFVNFECATNARGEGWRRGEAAGWAVARYGTRSVQGFFLVKRIKLYKLISREVKDFVWIITFQRRSHLQYSFLKSPVFFITLVLFKILLYLSQEKKAPCMIDACILTLYPGYEPVKGSHKVADSKHRQTTVLWLSH